MPANTPSLRPRRPPANPDPLAQALARAGRSCADPLVRGWLRGLARGEGASSANAASPDVLRTPRPPAT